MIQLLNDSMLSPVAFPIPRDYYFSSSVRRNVTSHSISFKGGCMGIAVSPIQIDSRVSDFIENPHKMLIDGRWVDAAWGKAFPPSNPATGEVLAHVAEGDRQDIDAAVQAAPQAFDSGPWSPLTGSERG